MAICDESKLEPFEWEDRSLNLLRGSKIDRELSEVKLRKKGGKRKKLKWSKGAMGIPQVILHLLDHDLRPNAIQRLSYFLLQRRKEEAKVYHETGYLLFNSCATMTILLQELISFSNKMVDANLDATSFPHITNVLTLLQCVAANNHTRTNFVQTAIPNFLIPLIQFDSPLVAFQNVRAVALSVIAILCQFREPSIIQWAIASNMVHICRIIVEVGTELSKVIAMHILEAILQDTSGLCYICLLTNSHLLDQLMQTWEHQVILLAADRDFSPRLLFHIIRCYFLLCRDTRGFNVVKSSLPRHFLYEYFQEAKEEYPRIGSLLNQLYITVG